MHLLNLGTMRDIIASSLTSWILDGILQKHLGTDYNEVNKALHRFTYHGKIWAKQVGEELNIKDTCWQNKVCLDSKLAAAVRNFCIVSICDRSLHEPKLECHRPA